MISEATEATQHSNASSSEKHISNASNSTERKQASRQTSKQVAALSPGKQASKQVVARCRGCSGAPLGAGTGNDVDCLSQSGSGSSSSMASKGRPPSRRQATRRDEDSSIDGDWSSREIFELDDVRLRASFAFHPFCQNPKLPPLLPSYPS
jgi:hypothetical protein